MCKLGSTAIRATAFRVGLKARTDDAAGTSEDDRLGNMDLERRHRPHHRELLLLLRAGATSIS